MTFFEAVVLGVVQGIAEFLPISSTAHLRVVPALLGWEDPGAAFSVVIQLGTLLAVLVYFAGDMRAMARAAARGLKSGRPWESQEALSVVHRHRHVSHRNLRPGPQEAYRGGWRSLYVIAASLILFGVLLWVAERLASFQEDLGQIGWVESQLVGLA